jgi:hypothetical protein
LKELTILLLATLACRREAQPHAARPVTQDTGFVGTTAPLHRVRPSGRSLPPSLLRTVEAAAGPANHYDRIVFEFAGDSVPGYHVEYASGPVRRCGSGDPVAVAGTARLVVRFESSRAHDDRGNPVPVQRERALGLTAVREIKLVCDFEGQVEWVLGVAAATPYRVAELAGPARLVLDVEHGR